MAKIDRAMYFINKNTTTISGSNLTWVAHQFFIYWKLSNMYGMSERNLNAESIFDGFSQLFDNNERSCAKSLYVNNEVTVEADVEIEVETYNLNVEQDGVEVDNINLVALDDDEFEIDEDLFRDELDDQVREMDWYIESSDNNINWNSIESTLVDPTEDNTLIYMYDKDMDIHSTDVESFISSQVDTIHSNNDGMTDDAYKSFMLKELKAQMEWNNTPSINETSV